MTGGFLALVLVAVQQAEPGPEAIRSAARRAEAVYERAARRFAPIVGQRSSASRCDEIVGRFCIFFGDEPADPPEEPARITDARRVAIDTLRRTFTHLPGDPAVAGPLVRLLIEDARAPEAVAAALTFAAETRDSVLGPLIAGFALHAAGEDSAAAARFEDGLARMDSAQAERVRSLEWLILHGERGRYRALQDAERSAYEEAVWRLADPLYVTPANETWVEHVARYTYARLMERVRVVRDMVRWGRDLEQLTIRYGMPYRRGRYDDMRFDQSGIVEYYHPAQLTYLMGDFLTRGVPPQPPPGERWPLDPERPRTAFAPPALRSMDDLPHQASRIPTGSGWVLRLDGAFGLDTLARVPPPPLPGDTAQPPAPVPTQVDAGLWLLDLARAAAPVADVRARVPLAGDSAHVALELPVEPGEYVYSLEGHEPETRTARRARYAITVDPAARLQLSDVIVTRPFEGEQPADHTELGTRPRALLVLARGERVGIFAQAADPGAGEYAIEIAVRPADRGSLPGRFVRWLGRSLGLGGERTVPRIAWRIAHEGNAPLVVAADLTLTGAQRGLQLIEVAIEDRRSGQRATGRRLVRIE